MSRERGKYYEQLAAQHLERNGLEIIRQNFLCRAGEIDLVCRDGHTLVFVEVKYRNNARFGSAVEMISSSKQQKLIRSAQFFLQRQAQYQYLPCRFDVVAITGCAANGNNQAKLDWIKNAFLIT